MLKYVSEYLAIASYISIVDYNKLEDGFRYTFIEKVLKANEMVFRMQLMLPSDVLHQVRLGIDSEVKYKTIVDSLDAVRKKILGDQYTPIDKDDYIIHPAPVPIIDNS